MALSNQDQQWVKAITAAAVTQTLELFIDKQEIAIRGLLDEHQAACPHGKKIEKGKMLIVGIAIGVGLAAGGAGFGLAKFVAGL